MLAAVCAVTGCSTPKVNSRGEAPRPAGAERLAADLAARGLRVAYANPLDSSVFTVPGSVYTVNGEDLQVFVYPTENAAVTDADRIAPSGGTVGTAAIRWIAPPHIFRKGPMIVIYLGSQAMIREALSAELGSQIAGAN